MKISVLHEFSGTWSEIEIPDDVIAAAALVENNSGKERKMAKFDPVSHLAELRSLSNEDFCKRLRGKYETAVGTYKPGPLQVEAARRIEELNEKLYGL